MCAYHAVTLMMERIGVWSLFGICARIAEYTCCVNEYAVAVWRHDVAFWRHDQANVLNRETDWLCVPGGISFHQ